MGRTRAGPTPSQSTPTWIPARARFALPSRAAPSAPAASRPASGTTTARPTRPPCPAASPTTSTNTAPNTATTCAPTGRPSGIRPRDAAAAISRSGILVTKAVSAAKPSFYLAFIRRGGDGAPPPVPPNLLRLGGGFWRSLGYAGAHAPPHEDFGPRAYQRLHKGHHAPDSPVI